jgi:hypothetical protein
MTRITWTTAVILVGSLAIAPATFAADGNPAPKLVSRTASPDPGHEEVMFTVPFNSQLLVTSACVQHMAMRIGIGEIDEDENRLNFGADGCTTYAPGVVVPGGETISCDNDSGVENSCLLVGVLETMPRAKGHRVKFHDLR